MLARTTRAFTSAAKDMGASCPARVHRPLHGQTDTAVDPHVNLWLAPHNYRTFFFGPLAEAGAHSRMQQRLPRYPLGCWAQPVSAPGSKSKEVCAHAELLLH